MHLIKPAEISSKIMTLIDEADEELIIVSPYNDLVGWQKLNNHLKAALKKKIKILYYARENEKHKGLEELGIRPVLINNLHAKIYMNEKYAIVASMNLVQYSDNNSLDIGYLIESPDQLKELRAFYDRYIKKTTEKKNIESTGQPKNENTLSYIKEMESENEVLFPEFVLNEGRNDVHLIKKGEFFKNYYTSGFIDHCGMIYNKKKIGPWLFFNENGFLKKLCHYSNGICENPDTTNYGKRVSLYDLIFSLANVIGGLYQVPIVDLYFKSIISEYVKEKKKLYQHIEEELKIQLDDQDHKTLEDLADDIKWHLKGKAGTNSYHQRNNKGLNRRVF
jgi:hypothetical protein